MATPADLFASFDSVLYDEDYTIGNGLSVHVFMSNWTLQSGYPVLKIAKNETAGTYSVTQVRTFRKNNINFHHVWYIMYCETHNTAGPAGILLK